MATPNPEQQSLEYAPAPGTSNVLLKIALACTTAAFAFDIPFLLFYRLAFVPATATTSMPHEWTWIVNVGNKAICGMEATGMLLLAVIGLSYFRRGIKILPRRSRQLLIATASIGILQFLMHGVFFEVFSDIWHFGL